MVVASLGQIVSVMVLLVLEEQVQQTATRPVTSWSLGWAAVELGWTGPWPYSVVEASS